MTTEQVIEKANQLITECIALELEIRDIKGSTELAANGLKGAMVSVNEAEKALEHAKRVLNFSRHHMK